MKKFLAQVALAIPMWFMLGSMTFAMCIWFAPPSRQFAPASKMKTLISQNEGTVTMTVQPQFYGDATDFALVMPFPSEARVEEAPENIFTELEDLTNPLNDVYDDPILYAQGEDTATERNEAVRVIEERDVGDYSTVSLSATNESALTTWLDNQGYEVTDAKKEIISRYVDSDGYFVALKVNMDKADVDDDGFVTGELKPISFVFEATRPSLPLQLMSGDGSLVTLTVYTLGTEYTYLPGGEIQFAKKIDATDTKDFTSLERYDAWQKWLVRNVVQVETDEITADLPQLTTTDTYVVVPGEEPLILDPDKLPQGTGVVVSDNGMVVYTEEEVVEPQQTPAPSNTSSLTSAMVIILAISNIVLLGIVIANHNSPKSTAKK